MKAIILAILISIAGCSSLLINIDDSNETFKSVPTTPNTLCTSEHKRSIATTEPQLQKIFKKILPKISDLTFSQRAVLFALLNIGHRPDVTSPTSSAMIVSVVDGELTTLFSTADQKPLNNEKTITPLINLLDRYLISNNSKRSLLYLAKRIDSLNIRRFSVSYNLSLQLHKLKEGLEENKILKRKYFKHNEFLQQDEKLPRFSFASLISKSLFGQKNSKYYDIGQTLFSNTKLVESNLPGELTCNFHFHNYTLNLMIDHSPLPPSNVFALTEGKRTVFFVTGQAPKAIPFHKTHFLQGTPAQTPWPFCYYKDKQMETVLFSINGRDPGQHLFHLFNYHLDLSNPTLLTIDKALKAPRHLFLPNPLRLIYESERGNEKQLQALLQYKLPIYHAEKLGKIWGAFSRLGSGQSSFLLDERRRGKIDCPKDL